MKGLRERDRAARRALGWFLVAALWLHIATMPLLTPLLPELKPRDAKPFRLVSMSAADLTKAQRQERKRKAEEKEAKRAKELKGQVVEIPPSADNTEPDDADYLSEHNTRTERETRSRSRSAEFQNAMNELSRTRREQNQQIKPSEAQALSIGPNEPQKETAKKQAKDNSVFEMPKLRQRDALALRVDPNLGTMHNQRRSDRLQGEGRQLRLSVGDQGEAAPPEGQAKKKGPTSVELVPSVGVLAQLSGGAMSDHLEDLEEGEGTFLNSREFKYASFFNRLKRGVSQHWRPHSEYRRRDPSGNVYGRSARVTVLQVTLKADGNLANLEVVRSSGVDFLDREAIAAFHRAQPFPNPPHGLVNNGTGLIDFPFGFHIDFSRRGIQLPF